jgi:hypothetical protein
MSHKARFIAGMAVVLFLVAACSPSAAEPTATPRESAESMTGMGMDNSQSTQEFAPLVAGLYEGGEVLFIHTEASDADVANMLTEMMAGPLVVLVPELAEAAPSLLANVYVFTSGVEGHGPFGFQADVFDSVPGDENYRPLRNVYLVAWQEGVEARELRSLADLQAAASAGEVAITQPGIVVNMPILVWPGGSR